MAKPRTTITSDADSGLPHGAAHDGRVVRIGTAGWSIPRAIADAFPVQGSGLTRYAGVFNAVEINATFYRLPRPATLERWREETPATFRFSVKTPGAITHEARLVDCDQAITAFVALIRSLGDRLGPILVQLPPSLAFDAPIAGRFFAALRKAWDGAVVCEPRHVSWFSPDAEALLNDYRIARAAADPARHPTAGEPGGKDGVAYWRLHGTPRMYASSYDEAYLLGLARAIGAVAAQEVWCIFDNTMFGAAAENARALTALISGLSAPPRAIESECV
jgi:uncharacterized protein YecE (DUF72 family)